MWALDFVFFVFKVLIADVILGIMFGVVWATASVVSAHLLEARLRRAVTAVEKEGRVMTVKITRHDVPPKSDAEHVDDLLDKL